MHVDNFVTGIVNKKHEAKRFLPALIANVVEKSNGLCSLLYNQAENAKGYHVTLGLNEISDYADGTFIAGWNHVESAKGKYFGLENVVFITGDYTYDEKAPRTVMVGVINDAIIARNYLMIGLLNFVGGKVRIGFSYDRKSETAQTPINQEFA